MDHVQFDHLARRLATARDRRGLLRSVAGTAAAIALAYLRGNGLAQEACPEACDDDEACVGGVCVETCEFDRHCRSKKDDPCIANACIDGLCVEAIIDCGPGYECCDEECCAKGCDVDEECAVVDPCQIGSCSPEGHCVFTQLDPCPVCASSVDCEGSTPNTLCCDGVCRRPCPEGTYMGKGCECTANGSAVVTGVVARDDASGSEGDRQRARDPFNRRDRPPRP